MVYKITDIVKDVRVAMDHNNVSAELTALGDSETLTLDEIIRSKIEDAARRVEMQAPMHMLQWEQAHSFGDAIYWGEDGSGWIVLPEDFMRLIVFEMTDWERACYEAISVDDPRYKLQRSRRKGLRGSPQQPVCAIAMRPAGLVLEFYTSHYSAVESECAKVQRAMYVPLPKIVPKSTNLILSYDHIDLAERCYPAIIYTIAALTCTAYGDKEKCAMYNEMAQTALN